MPMILFLRRLGLYIQFLPLKDYVRRRPRAPHRRHSLRNLQVKKNLSSSFPIPHVGSFEAKIFSAPQVMFYFIAMVGVEPLHPGGKSKPRTATYFSSWLGVVAWNVSEDGQCWRMVIVESNVHLVQHAERVATSSYPLRA